MPTTVRWRTGLLVGTLLAAAAAAATAQTPDATPTDAPALRRNEAMLVVDYQVIRVPGDQPIDLLGLHLHQKVADRLYLGAGVYAPMVRGGYGGFTAYDIGAHVRQPLGGRLFATAGLFGGGGGGGRSVEQSKVLSGTGRFFKVYAGLGYDMGGYALGLNLARMKFSRSAIDGTQANAFIEIPYAYLTGPYASRGEPLSAADARTAAGEAGENMFTLTLDNLRQIDPQGTNKATINLADLQFAHFVGRDTYAFAALGVGYRGLPLYNHVLGGVGQRVRLAPRVTLYGQLGIGSGGYAPGVIDTDAGLIVAPKVAAEFALTKDIGVALSGGYLAAPKGTSRNWSVGVALTRHLRSGEADAEHPATHSAWRLAVFQQTETAVRYRDVDRGRLHMIGLQIDMPVSDRWYLPLQASAAYTSYLGYPGYAEIFAGLGVQTHLAPGERLQGFAQLMAGANVHGAAAKASLGVRWLLSERLAVQASVGKTRARGSSGGSFSADSVGLGLDYRFTVPAW